MKTLSGWLYVAVVLAAGTLLYLGTLPFPMVFDDEIYLIGNPLFKEGENFRLLFTDLPRIARMAVERGLDGDISTNFIMRPLTYLSFHLNYRFGKLDPRGYRLINVAIHLSNALLVALLARVTLACLHRARGLQGKSTEWIAGVSGLLFLVHPLQLESVVYLVQRATSLCTLFYLSSVLCHFQANLHGSRLWRIASVFAALAAMLCKESGATLPALALLLDWWVCGPRTLVRLREAAWRARFLGLLLPLVPLLLATTSAAQVGDVVGKSLLTIAHGGNDFSHALHYGLTQPGVWLRYLSLFVWPFPQNADPEIPLVVTAADPWFWGATIGLLLLFCLPAIVGRSPSKKFLWESVSLGLGWFALTISPDSTFVPLPDVMAEHRTYLPSVGLCLGLAIVLCRHSEKRNLTWIGSALCLAGLSIATLKRRETWASAESFWTDVCAKSPGKPRPWINLGAAHYDAGRLQQAEAAFVRSIEVAPTVPAIANLAAVHLALDNPKRAYEIAKSGLAFRPSGYDAALLAGLANSSVRLHLWEDAVWAYSELLKLQPWSLTHRMQIAGCYLNSGNAGAAVEVLRAGLAASRDTTHPDAANLRSLLETAEQIASQSFKLQLGLSR